MSIRNRTWEIISAEKPEDPVSRMFMVAILSLIFLNVLAVIAGSVQSVQNRWSTFLNIFEIFSVSIFTVEYIARLVISRTRMKVFPVMAWSCPMPGPIR